MADSERSRGDVRHRILQAAETIAVRDGARHLTLEAAAREAGLSKGGVLYHFPSKQALFQAMIAGAIEDVMARHAKHRESLAGQANPTLRALVRTAAECMGDEIGLHSAFMAAAHEDPALLEPVRACFAALWKAIEAECGDPGRAFLVWSALEGLRCFAMFGVSPRPIGDPAGDFARLEAMAADLPPRGAASGRFDRPEDEP